MCIGEDNVFWTGTISQLCEYLIVGYSHKKYDDTVDYGKRTLSDISINYLKRKQTNDE